MKLVFLPSTGPDLLWMRAYYERAFPHGAKRAAEHYRLACRLIRDNPLIGHRVDDFPDVREFAIQRTPFSVIYRIVDERIEVLRIWDQRGNRSELV